MGTLNGKYTVGDAIEYTSVYGYAKVKFPVLNELGEAVGHVKEEEVIDADGTVISRIFYARNISRPNGQKRFYDSVESLIVAFGGTMDRVKKVAKPKKRAVKDPAKVGRAKKTA